MIREAQSDAVKQLGRNLKAPQSSVSAASGSKEVSDDINDLQVPEIEATMLVIVKFLLEVQDRIKLILRRTQM